MKNLAFVLLLCLFFLGCGEEKKQPVDINLNTIEQHYDKNTQFKSILVNQKFQKVVINDLKNVQKFEEFEFRNEKWKKIGEYNSEVTGNVYQKDFLFSLNDSVKDFVNFKIDSLNKIVEIEALRLESPEYYFDKANLELTFVVQEGMRDKKLIFNL